MSKLAIYHGSKDIIENHIIMVLKPKMIMFLDFIAQTVWNLQKNGLVAITKIMDLQTGILLSCLGLKF